MNCFRTIKLCNCVYDGLHFFNFFFQAYAGRFKHHFSFKPISGAWVDMPRSEEDHFLGLVVGVARTVSEAENTELEHYASNSKVYFIREFIFNFHYYMFSIKHFVLKIITNVMTNEFLLHIKSHIGTLKTL